MKTYRLRTASRHAPSAILLGAALGALLLLALPVGAQAPEAQQERAAQIETPPATMVAPQQGPSAGGGFQLSPSKENSSGLLWDGIAFLVSLPMLWWVLYRPRRLNEIGSPGFEIITHSERRQFIPLEEKFQHMDFLSKVETQGSLRLSANLNKVNLSFRRYGYLLEDKNFRNALLVNRRRVRRTLLRNGDVLDLGDLTLLYRDNREIPIVRHSAVTPRDGKVQVRFERLRGPVRKGTPMLASEAHPNRSFFVTKNLVFIGRSERNDLVVKSQNVDYRHAKIERIGGRYKLIDLSTAGNTFVNNRRVEQRILREGDEISIDNQRFRFRMVTKHISDSPPAQTSLQETAEGDSRENDDGDDRNSAAGGQNQASNAGD